MLGNADLLEALWLATRSIKNGCSANSSQSKPGRAYLSRINGFLGFLGESGEDLRTLLTNDQERKHVLRDYKRYLKQELKLQ